MDYINEVAHMLGVEMNERFKIGNCDELFHFEKRGLVNEKGESCLNQMWTLLNKTVVLKKLPFKPKYEEEYWYWHIGINEATFNHWHDYGCDFMAWKSGNCFRTKEEAENKGKELMESIVKEYNNYES